MKTKKSLQLWLPEEVHEQLEAVARREKRSKASQAVLFLERELIAALQDREAVEGGRTQVAMPASEEARASMLERVR